MHIYNDLDMEVGEMLSFARDKHKTGKQNSLFDLNITYWLLAQVGKLDLLHMYIVECMGNITCVSNTFQAVTIKLHKLYHA